MASHAQGQLDEDQAADLSRMIESEDVSESEAVRMCVNQGLQEFGYRNGSSPTWLEWFTGELAKALAYLAVGWLAATMFAPLEFRMLTVYLAGASIACFGMERFLRARSSRGTGTLARLFGGGEKA